MISFFICTLHDAKMFSRDCRYSENWWKKKIKNRSSYETMVIARKIFPAYSHVKLKWMKMLGKVCLFLHASVVCVSAVGKRAGKAGCAPVYLKARIFSLFLSTRGRAIRENRRRHRAYAHRTTPDFLAKQHANRPPTHVNPPSSNWMSPWIHRPWYLGVQSVVGLKRNKPLLGNTVFFACGVSICQNFDRLLLPVFFLMCFFFSIRINDVIKKLINFTVNKWQWNKKCRLEI